MEHSRHDTLGGNDRLDEHEDHLDTVTRTTVSKISGRQQWIQYLVFNVCRQADQITEKWKKCTTVLTYNSIGDRVGSIRRKFCMLEELNKAAP